MSLPSANNPLDAILYPTSETWLPSKKPVDLSFKGTAPKNVKFSIPPIRIKNLNVFIDVEKARRNKRTELLNRKAFLLEKSQNDMIEQNDIERRYAEQQAELKKLENLFANSLLAGVMENVVINSKNNILGQYFRDDPDISNFDKETEDVKTDAKNLLNLQESNAKLIQSINQSRQELENLIQQQIGEAQNDTEIEALEQSINELEAIAVIPEEGEIAEPTEVVEELDDDVIGDELEMEKDFEEKLESIREQLEEVKAKTQRGRPKMTEEEKQQRRAEKMEETSKLRTTVKLEKSLKELDDILRKAGWETDTKKLPVNAKTVRRLYTSSAIELPREAFSKTGVQMTTNKAQLRDVLRDLRDKIVEKITALKPPKPLPIDPLSLPREGIAEEERRGYEMIAEGRMPIR